MRYLFQTVPCIGLLTALALLLSPTVSSAAQSVLTLKGSIVNQTEHADTTSLAMPVRLTVIAPEEDLMTFQTDSLTDGSFEFKDIPSKIDATYFITVEYQGAVYSHSGTVEDSEQRIIIRIYDATDRTDVLDVESHSIIITGAAIQDRFIEILERVTLYNTGDKTMVANIGSETGKMPDLLRFALPGAASNIDLRSTLVGGEILEVDRGFAITTPIPPTNNDPHRFEFIYRVPYQTKILDLSRPLRFGAERVRVVVPETVGELNAPQLVYLGATNLNDSIVSLFEGSDFPRDTSLELSLNGIPQPSTWDWIRSHASYLYTTILVPSSVVLLILLAIVRIYTDRTKVVQVGFEKDLNTRRTSLLHQAALLNSHLDEKSISVRYYTLERQRIQAALIRIQIELDAEPSRGNSNQ